MPTPNAVAESAAADSDACELPGLAALSLDSWEMIYRHASTLDLLACACVSSALRRVCGTVLSARGQALRLSARPLSSAHFMWLCHSRMTASYTTLDVDRCRAIDKASVTKSLAAAPGLVELRARSVGPGSWTPGQLCRLLLAAPSSLRSGVIEADCRLSLCSVRGAAASDFEQICQALGAMAELRLRRLVIVTRTGAPPVAAGGETLEADRFLAAARLDRLRRLLIARGHLRELDGSSGALDREGMMERLVHPLLVAPGCSVRRLACAALSHANSSALCDALCRNCSLTHLALGCNALSTRSADWLANAIERHPMLETLTLEHNQILDAGGAALGASLAASRVRTLSLAFTGAADGACCAIATAIEQGAPLGDLNLCGNAIGPRGVQTLADAIARTVPSRLHHLDLSANHRIDAGALRPLVAVLPASTLRGLALSGCQLHAKFGSQLAAVLPRSELTELDLSANPLGDEGAWSLAWSLAGSRLRRLDLSNCNVTTDGADELLRAAAGASHTTTGGRAEGGCNGRAAAAPSEGTAAVTSMEPPPPRALLESLDLRGNQVVAEALDTAVPPWANLGFQRKA